MTSVRVVILSSRLKKRPNIPPTWLVVNGDTEVFGRCTQADCQVFSSSDVAEALEEARLDDDPEGRKPGGHGQRVAGEGAGLIDGAVRREPP